MRKGSTVLIVDDDKSICELISEELSEQGYDCDFAFNANDALDKLKGRYFDVALLDIKLPGISGIDLLKVVVKCYQMTEIVMITAVNDLDTAIEAMKMGASDYIVKPFTFEKLNTSITSVLESGKQQWMVYNAIPSIRDGYYIRNTNSHYLSEINAIAYGVDAQVDYFDFHSKIVTRKTVELAQWLGLPEKEIKKWAVARNELYSDMDRRIKSVLNKLEQSPIAQVILGLTRSIHQFSKSSQEQN